MPRKAERAKAYSPAQAKSKTARKAGDQPKKRGRPTDYRPEYCEKVVRWGKQGKSIAWMAARFDVHKDTVYEWAKVHPDFSDALKRAETQSQAYWEDLGQDGLDSDKFNSGLWAKNMAARFRKDWSERLTHLGDPETPVQHQHGHAWMTQEEAKARGWA